MLACFDSGRPPPLCHIDLSVPGPCPILPYYAYYARAVKTTSMTDSKTNSPGLGEYLARAFNGHTITHRHPDGYINATEMCKVNKKRKLNDWRRNKDTEAFIDALSAFTGIPVIGLVESKVGGAEAGGGTWIHPESSIHLAMWLDARFAVQVLLGCVPCHVPCSIMITMGS
jgi:hypothetical protein